jgi:hypothetical protein
LLRGRVFFVRVEERREVGFSVKGDLKGKWEGNEGKSVVRRLFLFRNREQS